MAVGTLLLGVCSGAAVEYWIELLNHQLEPSRVIWIMTTPAAQALIDPHSLPRELGPWLGLALIAIGLGLLTLRRAQPTPVPQAPLEDAAHPHSFEPIPLP